MIELEKPEYLLSLYMPNTLLAVPSLRNSAGKVVNNAAVVSVFCGSTSKIGTEYSPQIQSDPKKAPVI